MPHDNGVRAQTKDATPTVKETALEQENRILEVIRAHLREARQSKAIGGLVFRFALNRGGITEAAEIELEVNYRFKTLVG